MKRIFEFKPIWLLQILFVIVGFLIVLEYRKTDGQSGAKTDVQEASSPNLRNSVAQPSIEESPPAKEDLLPLKLERAVVCLDVEGGDPVLAKSAFNKNIDYLYCHTTVSGPEGGYSLYHRWIHRGEQVSEFRLSGDGRHSKLWSKREMSYKMAGDWQVKIIAENGEELGAVEFTLN